MFLPKYWQCKEKQFVCRMPLGNAQRFSRSIPEVDYKIVTLHLKRPKVLNNTYRYYPSMPKLFLARLKNFWYAWIITYTLAWAGEAYSRVFNLSIDRHSCVSNELIAKKLHPKTHRYFDHKVKNIIFWQLFLTEIKTRKLEFCVNTLKPTLQTESGKQWLMQL
mgnify:CR=1 FL=1